MPVSESSDLYGLPLERFVAERDGLAKALRGEGRRDEAAQVAALRKPSVAAWTVNQLVRTQVSSVALVFDAGDELRRAQSELLSGRGDPVALREASRRERQAINELTEVARGLLSSDGHEPTQATLDRVGETLRAAALDGEARAQVREARLERELRQVGFGAGGALGLIPGAARSSGAMPARATPRREGKGDSKRGHAQSEHAARAEREQAERAEREHAERERAERERAANLEGARRAEAAARRLAGQTTRQVEVAEERRDRAAGALRDADAALAAARERAEEAALGHRRAQHALDDV